MLNAKKHREYAYTLLVPCLLSDGETATSGSAQTPPFPKFKPTENAPLKQIANTNLRSGSELQQPTDLSGDLIGSQKELLSKSPLTPSTYPIRRKAGLTSRLSNQSLCLSDGSFRSGGDEGDPRHQSHQEARRRALELKPTGSPKCQWHCKLRFQPDPSTCRSSAPRCRELAQ